MNQLVPSSNEVQPGQATDVSVRDRSTFVPRVDTLERPDELLMFVDLPGVTAENLDVRFENGELTIHGHVPNAEDAPGSERDAAPVSEAARPKLNSWLSEYQVGDYRRTFSLDESIATEQISAELKNGVLTVRLPKVEQMKPRRIEVTGG